MYATPFKLAKTMKQLMWYVLAKFVFLDSRNTNFMTSKSGQFWSCKMCLCSEPPSTAEVHFSAALLIADDDV